jgi:hypothetical protein
MQGKRKFGGYTVAGVRPREEKNWGAQLVMAFLLAVLFCGPLTAHFLGWRMSVATLGAAVAIDVLLILAIALWALRRWDY